jgi:hypothetical protein
MIAAGEKRPAKGIMWKEITLDNWQDYFDKAHRGGVGVRMGKVSGIVTIDLDKAKDGEVDGLEYWQRLEALHGAPKTRRNKTKNGLHLYFKTNKWTDRLKGGSIRCMTDACTGQKVAIDFLADNRYAKNFSEDGSYAWVDPNAEIAEFPEWLYNALDAKCYDTAYAPSEISSTTSAEPEWEDVGREDEAGPADPLHEYARAQIGDMVKVGRTEVELTPELIRTILNHQPAPEGFDEWMSGVLINVRSTVRSGEAATRAQDVYEVFDAWSSNHPGYDEGNNARLWMSRDTIKAANRQAAHIESLIGRAVKNGLSITPPVNPFYTSELRSYQLIKILTDGTERTWSEVAELVEQVFGCVTYGDCLYAIKSSNDKGELCFKMAKSVEGFARHKVKIAGAEKDGKVPLSKVIGAVTPEYSSYTAQLAPPGEPTIDTGTRLNLCPAWKTDCRTEGPLDPEVIAAWDYHMLTPMANGDETLARFGTKWYSYLFQHPNKAPKSALVFIGLEGTGKTSIARIMEQLMGQQLAWTTTGAEKLLGKFNSLLVGRKYVMLDEACLEKGQYMSFTNKLKGIVDSSTISIEKKGIDPVELENILGLNLASNSDTPFSLTSHKRRFAVFKTSDKHKGDKEYFDRFYEIMARPHAMAHLLEHFMRQDLTDFDPQDIPSTAGARDMVMDSMAYEARYMLDVFREAAHADDAAELVLSKAEVQLKVDRMAERDHEKLPKPAALTRKGKQFGIKSTKRTPVPGAGQVPCYVVDRQLFQKRCVDLFGADFEI